MRNLCEKRTNNMNANLKCNTKKPDHPYEGASFLKRWTFWWVQFFFPPFSMFGEYFLFRSYFAPCWPTGSVRSPTKFNKNKNVFFSFSALVYRWLKDLFKLGLQRPIENEDIYRTLKEHECTRLSDRFETLWNEERKKQRPHLFTVIRQVYAKKIIGISILFTAIDAISRCVFVCAIDVLPIFIYLFFLRFKIFANILRLYKRFLSSSPHSLVRTEQFSHNVWAVW